MLFTLPVFYEKYDDKVDSFAEKAIAEIKKQYVVFDEKVLSKIPRGPLKDKKIAWEMPDSCGSITVLSKYAFGRLFVIGVLKFHPWTNLLLLLLLFWLLFSVGWQCGLICGLLIIHMILLHFMGLFYMLSLSEEQILDMLYSIDRFHHV